MTAAFETDRLLVRDWTDTDADRMLDMYSRDDVVRFLGSVPTPMSTREQALDRIARGRTLDLRETSPRYYGKPLMIWASRRA